MSNRNWNAVAQRGLYSFDTYTPVNNTTFEVAFAAAHLAQRAAQKLLETDVTQYALCRPPGHHAEPAMMGGYCYFNNGGVAAQTIANAHAYNRVTILDVDFHHGNGAEKIFGNTESIQTISIHADPSIIFPYFSGWQTDVYNSNLNIPLPLGVTNRQYDQVLAKALTAIQEHRSTHVVVCYGADTHESDPIGGFALTTDYYMSMANQIMSLQLPTVVVQEGGYNTEMLGDNVAAFLGGV